MSGREGSLKDAAALGQLFDAHAHLSFAPDAARFGGWVAERFAGAFSTTVTPEDFERARALFASLPAVKVGVGAHPWWISQGKLSALDVEAAALEFAHARFIGEIGLDFGKNGMRERAFESDEAAKEAQVSALRTIFAACVGEVDSAEGAGGRVFSFHAVQSADVIMDLLEEYGLLAGNTAIFHWFSGSSTQLQRARELGCSFSVNAFMLNTKRGREYAKAIPLDQLLVETDLPEEVTEGDEGSHFALVQKQYESALVSAYEQIAELLGAEALRVIAHNVSCIFAVGE